MTSPPANNLSKPLKIALICDWYLPRVGGLEMHLRDLAHGLMQNGHEVHVVTPTPGSKVTEEIRVHRLKAPMFPYFHFVWTRKAFKKMAAIFREEKFDLVHCHSSIVTPAAYGGAYIAQKMGVPTVITCHSLLKYFKPVFVALDFYYKWTRWPIIFSAVSEVAASYIRRWSGGNPVHLLPNGVDPSEWAVIPESKNPDEVWIVSVMRLNRKKRPLPLIKMIAQVMARLPKHIQLKVKVAGGGPERGEMEKLISRLALGKTVELLGVQTREEIRALYAKTDIAVLPTIHESFGLSVLEARCAGLPIVAMNNSGIQEIIHNGREGLLAHTDEEMVEHLVQLVTDPQLRTSIARHNRETTPPHDWKSVLSLHEELYQKAIEMR